MHTTALDYQKNEIYIVVYYLIWQCLICLAKNVNGFKCNAVLLQTYISAILENVQNKNNYLSIMGNLLIHSTKKVHKGRLEELLKVLLKKWFKDISLEMSVIQNHITVYWEHCVF